MDDQLVEEQHIYQHADSTPRISVKVEKNTKGYNWEAGISNAINVEDAMALLQIVTQSLERVYGTHESK